MGSKILAIVCANGLGHFRRTIGIFDRLLGIAEVSQLTIACEPWQWEQAREWDAARRVRRHARTIEGIAHPGPGWTRDPKAWEDGRLVGWEERAKALPELEEADLVTSDNLAGVLSVRSDAVLLGSFLWSDVLEPFREREVVRTFVDHERALLEEHRPAMLCVADVVMPGVRRRANAVELAWMCEREGSRARRGVEGRRARVLVLGGATGAASDVLEEARRALAAESGVELVADPGFDRELDLGGVDLVVCRPGVGTLTQCVAERVPMILAYEPGNLELEHNAAAVAKIGGAIDCGSSPEGPAIVDAAKRAIASYEEMSSALARRSCDGLDRAAEWLAAKLTG